MTHSPLFDSIVRHIDNKVLMEYVDSTVGYDPQARVIELLTEIRDALRGVRNSISIPTDEECRRYG